MNVIYLDNSATTRVLPEVADTVHAYLTERFYNPAGAYAPALDADRDVKAAREALARAFGAQPDEIVFTSGGTESNNMAIFGTLRARRDKGHIITTGLEHASVYRPFIALRERGYALTLLGADSAGAVRMEELRRALTPETILVSLMHINNETGAITDIQTAYALIKRHAPNALLHVDGVQAFCKLPITKPVFDLYSISGHKFHAPKGVGALYVRGGVAFAGGQIGGGQERGLRSGTTNTPGIMGMRTAQAMYQANGEQWMTRIKTVKHTLMHNLLQIPDVMVNGPQQGAGAPHILNVSFLGVKGETLLNALSGKGIYVSTGSACSARKKTKNRVLSEMGLPPARQDSAIRFSFCPFNTINEVNEAAHVIDEQLRLLRKFQKR